MLPMILNIVDMTGGTTNAPYDPKDDEGGFGDVGRIMQVYCYLIILLNLSFKGAGSVIRKIHNCSFKCFNALSVNHLFSFVVSLQKKLSELNTFHIHIFITLRFKGYQCKSGITTFARRVT